jgi:hypothetical protein
MERRADHPDIFIKGFGTALARILKVAAPSSHTAALYVIAACGAEGLTFSDFLASGIDNRQLDLLHRVLEAEA